MPDKLDLPIKPLLQQFLPALRMDAQFYEEVAADSRRRGQAVLVILMAGVLNGLALRDRLGPFAMWGGVGASFIGWGLWTLVVQLIALLFRCQREDRSIARPLAFANVPCFFLVLGVFPEMTTFVRLAVPLWLIATSTAAVRAAYRISYQRAAILTVIAFVLYLLIGMVLPIG